MFITGGRRDRVDHGSILKFVMGTGKEPLLEFKLHPSLFFYQDQREEPFSIQEHLDKPPEFVHRHGRIQSSR